MRTVLWIVVAGMLGCADHADDTYVDPFCGNGYPDPQEECDTPGVGLCSETCTLLPDTVTFSWVFTTLDGTTRSTCLPGDPDVVFHLSGDHRAPCASGSVAITAKFFGPTYWSMTCDADHEYRYDGAYLGTAPPMAALYTDVGNLTAKWTETTSDGTLVNCANDMVQLSLDQIVVQTTFCGTQQAILSNIPIGPHTLQAESFNAHGGLLSTSQPIDVTVLASANVDGVLALQAY